MKDPNHPSLHKLVVVPLWAWVFLGVGFVFLFCLLLWAFFGSIPITVSGRGIVIPAAGLFSVQAPVEGSVLQIAVKEGSVIKKGDLLIQIYDPQVQLKYEEAKTKVLLLKNQLQNLKIEIKTEEKALGESLNTKRQATVFTITQLQNEIRFAKKEMESRQDLIDQGLISRSLYNQGVQAIAEKTIELQNKIGELADIDSQMKKEYRANEITAKSQQLQEATEEERILKSTLDQGKIYSQFEGRVLEVLTNVGDFIHLGTPLFWLENSSYTEVTPKRSLILGFFQVDAGKRIRTGNPVKMRFPNVNYNQYGSITGEVQDISLFAVSQEQLYNRIHNKTLIDYLTDKASAVVQVTIEPDLDPKHPKAFHWTSGLQPPFSITFGTVGDIETTVEMVHPIYYLIPLTAFKKT